MTMEVRGPGGIVVRFPDGTDKATIDQAMRQAIGKSGPDFSQAAETGNDSNVEAAYARANPLAASGGTPLAANAGVGETIGTAVSNIVPSAQRFGSDIVSAVTHPIETVKNLGRVAAGGIEKLIPGEQQHEVYANAVGKFFADRYGGVENIKKTLAEDPIGLAADLSMLLTGGSTAGARLTGTAGEISRVAGTVGRVVDPVNAAVNATRNIAKPIVDVGKAVAKPFSDATYARINPAGAAVQKVAERIVGSGQTIDQVANRIERAATQGQTLNIADAGGRGVQTLARTVANTPGKGADRIAARTNLTAAAQGDRLKRAVSDAFNAPEGAYQAAKATVMDARSSAAKPYYDLAYATPVPFTFHLEELLNTPAGRAGLAAAKQNSLNRREPWAQWFANVADDGSIIDIKRVPDTRALDEVKRALDPMVEAAKQAADGSPFAKAKATPKSIAIQSVRDDLNKFLKKENPHYAKAQQVGLDNIQADEALEFGRDALNTDSRVIAQRMGSPAAYGRDRVLNDGQRELARVGLAEAIRDKIDKAGMTHNGLLKFFSTKEQVARIRPFFETPQEFSRFRAQMLNEARKRKTLDMVRGNSTTARQLADLQDAGQMSDTVSVIAQAATGGPVAAALSVLQRGLRRLGGLTPKVADEMSKLLLAQNPDTVRGILAQMRQIEESRATGTVKAVRVMRLLTDSLRVGVQTERSLQGQETRP